MKIPVNGCENMIKIIVLIIFVAQLGLAQDSKPLIEVQSAVDTSLITIGDRINYSVSIEHKEGMRVEQPGAGVNLGQFEIKNYKIIPPYSQDDRVFIKYEYEISVFDTGKFTIPPFPVAYFPTDSTKDYKLIEANPINIYVESVIQDGDKELKDIKPPVYVPYDYVFAISVAAIIIAILAAGFFAYRFYRKKKETGFVFKAPELKRPAHEIALADLDALIAGNLLAERQIKQYYIELSDIIRHYIEGRFFIPALEETSFEILTEIRSQELNQDLYQLLTDFLGICDLVKFAKHIPSEDEHGTNADQARRFVEETKIEMIVTEAPQTTTVNESEPAVV